MTIRHKFGAIYLFTILPLAYLGIQQGWTTSEPSVTLPIAVRDVGALLLIAAFGLGVIARLVQSESKPFRSWPLVVIGAPILTAVVVFLYVSFSYQLPPPILGQIGTTLFWFAGVIYALNVIQLVFEFSRSVEI